VLVVDDDAAVRTLLRTFLHRQGYTVLTAEDGVTAELLVKRELPDLILLDVQLPVMSGDEVCRRLKQNPRTQLIPVIMLTGFGDFQCKLEAWGYGADDFITKPFQLIEVGARCRSLLRLKSLVEERESAENMLFSWARALEAKNPYTRGHADRVARYAGLLADAVGLEPRQRQVLTKGALLHDIGKIGTPDAILNKPGPLDADEFAIIKDHPAEGSRIVEPLRSLHALIPIIRWHHERPDGKGYPDGLCDEQIPFLVRFISVADVYDSLSSARPYRQALPLDRCLHILRETAAEGGLDGELTTLFCELMQRQQPVEGVPEEAWMPPAFNLPVSA
jgi:putative two-component system response regulator